MANSEKTIIITGANTGIGFNATCKLSAAGYSIILACRNQQNAEEAISNIKKSNQDANLTFIQLDLSDLSSVRTFVKEFHSTGRDLYGLINNAGMALQFGDKDRQVTKDGFERTMATNHFGHFLLTNLLIEDLKKGAAKFGHAKVINISSTLHNKDIAATAMKRVDKNREIADIDLDDLMMEKEGAYIGLQAYKNSKAANVMFAYSLSRKLTLEVTGVMVNALCPGFIPSTGLSRESPSGLQFFMKYIIGGIFRHCKRDVIKTVDEGGAAISDMILSDKFTACNGCFISNGEIKDSSEETRDETKQQKLWDASATLTGL